MVKISLPARLAVTAIALVLMLPVLLMPWSDGVARTAWEKRPLTTFSSVVEAFGGEDFFATLEDYVDDHAFGALSAARSYRKFKFYWLKESPQPNIVLGSDGLVFLTSHDVNRPYGSLERLCQPQERHPKMVHEGLQAFASRLAERGVRLTLAVVPSKLALYVDRLPSSVPQRWRSICLDAVPGRTVAFRLGDYGEEANYAFVYPFAELREQRDKLHFYPVGNFHSDSLINHEFGKRFFETRRFGLPESFKRDPVLTEVSADLRLIGFSRRTKVWRFAYEENDYDRDNRLPQWLKDNSEWPRGYLELVANDNRSSRHALMVSDSFGPYLAPHVAAPYKTLTRLSLSHFGMDEAQRVGLLNAALDATKATELIILMHDVGLPNPNFRRFVSY